MPNEPFVHVAKKGVLPQTQNVRGSNYVQIGVVADRIKNRAIVISTLDNLVKGSAGQAIQNMNLMFGLARDGGAGADRAVSVTRGAAVDEETLQFYRGNAEAYAGREITSRQARLTAFLALLPPGACILELGCGAGGDTAEMLARGFDVRADRRVAGNGWRRLEASRPHASRRCCFMTSTRSRPMMASGPTPACCTFRGTSLRMFWR